MHARRLPGIAPCRQAARPLVLSSVSRRLPFPVQDRNYRTERTFPAGVISRVQNCLEIRTALSLLRYSLGILIFGVAVLLLCWSHFPTPTRAPLSLPTLSRVAAARVPAPPPLPLPSLSRSILFPALPLSHDVAAAPPLGSGSPASSSFAHRRTTGSHPLLRRRPRSRLVVSPPFARRQPSPPHRTHLIFVSVSPAASSTSGRPVP
jgi:hypothetical protein